MTKDEIREYHLKDFAEAAIRADIYRGQDESLSHDRVLKKSLVEVRWISGYPVLVWPVWSLDEIDTGLFKIAWNGL